MSGLLSARAEKALAAELSPLLTSSTPAAKDLGYLCSATVLCDIGCGGMHLGFPGFEFWCPLLFPASSVIRRP